MPDDKGRRTSGAAFPTNSSVHTRPTPTTFFAGQSGTVRPDMQTREPRVPVAAPVKIRYESILDFHEMQSVNISRTGMFLSCPDPRPVGTIVDFELALADGLSLLKGKGEVVRVSSAPTAGMGVRFSELDQDARRFLERIVMVNEQEGRAPSMPLDFTGPEPSPSRPPMSTPVPAGANRANPLRGATLMQPGLMISGRELHIKLTPATVGYFINNPLLNIRLGGFVVPCEENVNLGAVFEVVIESFEGHSLFAGKGKVVAKQEHRLGIRLSDADKKVLGRLQTEVARLSPFGR